MTSSTSTTTTDIGGNNQILFTKNICSKYNIFYTRALSYLQNVSVWRRELLSAVSSSTSGVFSGSSRWCSYRLHWPLGAQPEYRSEGASSNLLYPPLSSPPLAVINGQSPVPHPSCSCFPSFCFMALSLNLSSP